MSDVKEFRVKMRLYNNRLVRLREAEGLNCREMAERLDMSYGTYLGYENMSENPINKRKGIIKPAAEKIMRYFGETFEYLWPDVVLMVENNKAETELSGDVALSLTGDYARNAALPPDVLYDDKEKHIAARAAVLTLEPKHRQVLKDRFGLGGDGELTLAECGDKMGTQPERARQVEARALRVLRSGRRGRHLVKFVEDFKYWWEED